MADEEAFLQAIDEAPGDETTRLVFADWLDEQGDFQRANFLRLECAWAAQQVPANLRCHWRKELPPIEERYPPVLRQLSEVDGAIDLRWIALVSRIAREFQSLTDRFAARIPVTRSERPAEVSARVSRWQAAVEEVRRMFAATVGEQVAQERFAVPIDHVLFGVTVGGLDCPEDYGMSYFDALYSPETMAEQTISMCNVYARRNVRREHLAGCGLWLFVGNRDKHDLHLCCDQASPFFGVLADQHDSHPWISPPHGPVTWDVISRSFLDYLRWEVTEAERDEAEQTE